MRTNHLQLHDVSATSSQAVGRDCGAGGCGWALLHGASTSSLLKGFHVFETFQAFLITDFKCCLTPETFNICNRGCNCQASIDMFLLDMVQTWALAALVWMLSWTLTLEPE